MYKHCTLHHANAMSHHTYQTSQKSATRVIVETTPPIVSQNTEFRFLFFVKIMQYYTINIYNDDLTFVPELELRVFSIPVWFGKQSDVC